MWVFSKESPIENEPPMKKATYPIGLDFIRKYLQGTPSEPGYPAKRWSAEELIDYCDGGLANFNRLRQVNRNQGRVLVCMETLTAHGAAPSSQVCYDWNPLSMSILSNFYPKPRDPPGFHQRALNPEGC